MDKQSFLLCEAESGLVAAPVRIARIINFNGVECRRTADGSGVAFITDWLSVQFMSVGRTHYIMSKSVHNNKWLCKLVCFRYKMYKGDSKIVIKREIYINRRHSNS